MKTKRERVKRERDHREDLRFLFLFEHLDSPNEEGEINAKINKRENKL